MSGVGFVDRQTSDILAGLAQVFEAYSEEEKKALIRKVCPPPSPPISHPSSAQSHARAQHPTVAHL